MREIVHRGYGRVETRDGVSFFSRSSRVVEKKEKKKISSVLSPRKNGMKAITKNLVK